MAEERPAGYAIFCDDIRQEVGNKASLMGTYMSDIILYEPTFPITLSKLGMLIQYEQPIGDVRDYRIEIYMPVGDDPSKPIAQTDVRASEVKITGKTLKGAEAVKISARMHLLMAPVVLKEAGTMKVIIVRQGDEPLQIGKLEIVHQPRTPEALPDGGTAAT